MSMDRSTLRLLASIWLAGCTGGSGGDADESNDFPSPSIDPSLCAYMAGGAVDFTPMCADCTVANDGLASDGDPASYASMTLPALTGVSVALRVHAPQGVTSYPILTNPAVIVSSMGTGADALGTGFEIRTYLNGVLMANSNTTSINVVSGGNGSQPHRISTLALTPFDAVEIAYTRAAGTGDFTINVHEFCSDT